MTWKYIFIKPEVAQTYQSQYDLAVYYNQLCERSELLGRYSAKYDPQYWYVHSVHVLGRIRLGARELPPPPYYVNAI